MSLVHEPRTVQTRRAFSRRGAIGSTLMLAVALQLGVPSVAQAQSLEGTSPLLIDLAGPQKDSVNIQHGRYTIEIQNLVPKHHYTMSISVNHVPIPPLSREISGLQESTDACAAGRAAIATFEAIDAEEAIPIGLAALKAARQALPAGCSIVGRGIDALVSASVRTYASSTGPVVYNVEQGMLIRIRVTRTDAQGANTRTWDRVFTTGPAGSWIATYGYAAVGTEQRTYYSKEESAGKYKIVAEREPQDLDLVQVVLLSFKPAEDRTWSHSWTAGIGPDLSNPLALLGWGVTYWSNVQVSLGLIARKEGRLLGKYAPNDIITENLTSDQLREQAWRVRPFISLGFRFADNIFKRDGERSQPAPESPPSPPKQKE